MSRWVSPCALGLLLRRRRAGSSTSGAARIVSVRHAFVHEGVARRALKFLGVGPEFAGCHFIFFADGVGRNARQYHGQHGGDESISMHDLVP
jgi:hypothetical protein